MRACTRYTKYLIIIIKFVRQKKDLLSNHKSCIFLRIDYVIIIKYFITGFMSMGPLISNVLSENRVMMLGIKYCNLT